MQKTVHRLTCPSPEEAGRPASPVNLGVMRSSASLLGPDPGRTRAHWLPPALQSLPSIPAVTPTPPSSLISSAQRGRQGLSFAPDTVSQPVPTTWSRVPNVLPRCPGGGAVTTSSGPAVSRCPVHHWSCWTSIRSNLRSLEPVVTWGLAGLGLPGSLK